jgi:ribonuclease BN (tRNA processing enzyme)
MLAPNDSLAAIILGSGTCVPSLQRSACSALVFTDQVNILLDCGPITIHKLLEINTTINDIDYLLLSHFHPDHTGELVNILFATKYPDGNQRGVPLTVIGGPGFNDFYSGLEKVYGPWMSPSADFVTLIEMPPDQTNTLLFGSISVATTPTEHRPESIAYRISDPYGKTIVYSGDTDVSENLIALAQDADIFICESALPDDLKAPGHLTPSLAGKMAQQANVKKLVLTHFYPECEKADIISQCRKNYSGPLVIAQDLMRIKI